MEVNLIKVTFAFCAFFIIAIGSLVNWFEKYIPVILPQTFRYGKFAYRGKPSKMKVIEVPKSSFKHFYVFASLYSLYALYLAIDVYLYDGKPPYWFVYCLDLVCGTNRKTEVNHLSVLIALTLLTLQSFRRGYETWFVSVFSDTTINLTQYLIGYYHYWGAITSILAEAEGFDKSRVFSTEHIGKVSLVQIFAITLFLFAWIFQYKSAKTLANLRKNKFGEVVTKEHKISRGGLFEFVLVWVISNQMESSLLSHWWYLSTFKDYPKNRRAIIPWIL